MSRTTAGGVAGRPGSTNVLGRAVQARRWRYAQEAIARDPQLSSIYRSQLALLKFDTPAMAFVPRGLQPGVTVTQVRHASGDNVHAIFEVHGLAPGASLPGIALMPTSGHYGLDAQQLAQDQRHTLWVVHGAETYSMRNAQNTLVDGAQSFGPAGQRALVTAVATEIPLRPGSNRLHFDPYPGKSAGVGGYPGGRTIEFIVK